MTACLWALAAIGAVVLAIVAFVYGALCGINLAMHISLCADRAIGVRNDVALARSNERFGHENINMAVALLGGRGLFFPGRGLK